MLVDGVDGLVDGVDVGLSAALAVWVEDEEDDILLRVPGDLGVAFAIARALKEFGELRDEVDGRRMHGGSRSLLSATQPTFTFIVVP